MGFRQRHPYLFWQLIGWGILLADAAFFITAALNDFGEWSYPVIVFAFIAGLFAVAASPVIVRTICKKQIPQNSDRYTERLLRQKIGEITAARGKGKHNVAAAILVFPSVIVFMFAAYILGEYVHLALGFASMVLAVVVPFLIIGISSSVTIRGFFAVKNGEKTVDIVPLTDARSIADENPHALIFSGEPDAVLLNFFRNWLHPYLRGKRLTFYRVPVSALCAHYSPSSILRYEDVLFFIPTEQLDLDKEKAALFNRECGIMGALTFAALTSQPTEFGWL